MLVRRLKKSARRKKRERTKVGGDASSYCSLRDGWCTSEHCALSCPHHPSNVQHVCRIWRIRSLLFLPLSCQHRLSDAQQSVIALFDKESISRWILFSLRHREVFYEIDLPVSGSFKELLFSSFSTIDCRHHRDGIKRLWSVLKIW